MGGIEGIIFWIGVFGVAPAMSYVKYRARLADKKLELEAKTGGNAGDTKKLLEENKLLRERVENLEAIVCSVDHELNQKVAKLVDEQRAQLPAPSPTPAPAPNVAPDQPAALAPRAAVPAPATPSSIEPGQMLAGRYRVQRLLGKGGMGAVYLADDEVLHELVALKVISSAFSADEAALIARFRREASAARKVSSPYV